LPPIGITPVGGLILWCRLLCYAYALHRCIYGLQSLFIE
jgi:hypothetical protein